MTSRLPPRDVCLNEGREMCVDPGSTESPEYWSHMISLLIWANGLKSKFAEKKPPKDETSPRNIWSNCCPGVCSWWRRGTHRCSPGRSDSPTASGGSIRVRARLPCPKEDQQDDTEFK